MLLQQYVYPYELNYCTHVHTHTHTHSNIEQILATQGESAKRIDDSTIELTPEDLIGTQKLSAALGEEDDDRNKDGSSQDANEQKP